MMKASLKTFSTQLLKRSIGIVLIPLVLVAPAAHADEAAIRLLNRMNHALHQLNYSGTLAYLRDNSLSSLHIEHSVVNGVEGERVVRLNEAGNEVSRELQGFSLASIPIISPEMEKVYSFDMGRENRIADIPCVIITARPKDRERYLQKYCIDSVTGMLLDYMLVGKSHKPVEQFMFTSIKISIPEGSSASDNVSSVDPVACSSEDCADKAAIAPTNMQVDGVVATTAIVDQAVSSKTKSTIITPRAMKLSRQISSADLDDGWVIETLPAGFEISQAPSMKSQKTVKEGDDQLDETKHYVISDGLSSLSVFVSPLNEDAPMGAVKINSGALNVISQQKGNSIITVVGEVPEGTLRNIVDNLNMRKK
jgi:negative regulator of sigma E activity